MTLIPPRPLPFRPGEAGRLAEAIVAAWYPATAPELFRRKLVEAIRTALLRAYGQGRADSLGG